MGNGLVNIPIPWIRHGISPAQINLQNPSVQAEPQKKSDAKEEVRVPIPIFGIHGKEKVYLPGIFTIKINHSCGCFQK